MIKSILIANRSEIAIRISKTAKRLGIKTYMFLTHQEPNALYLEHADEVIDVSADTFTNIFMDVEKIVNYASEYKIDAVHPGYGFLSENPYLAKSCEDKGITFIGPSYLNIEKMGNKGIARQLAIQSKVPVVPGSDGIVASFKEAKEFVDSIGYPVIVKAVAGGGGKGMRIVQKASELQKMYNAASNEAQTIFGNGAVFIERYIQKPRHIEVQVLGDQHGNVVHLFDRECSIQRKHQKLMEEAPSPGVSDELRAELCKDAVNLCHATGYYSAGTVEFLVDENNHHYFMEMNTRIQVEHPVTEAITGVDLVEQQIKVANGEKLSICQDDIKIQGSAIEFRVNAEDVQAGFIPSSGIIQYLEAPADESLRFDSGFVSGKIVPACYDSLIAKAIVFAPTRDEVIAKSKKILNAITVRGIKTTIPFFKEVLTTPSFLKGHYYTNFIEKDMKQLYFKEDGEYEAAACIALEAYLEERAKLETVEEGQAETSPWIMKSILK